MQKTDKKYAEYLNLFEGELHNYINSFHASSSVLFEAMKYSLEVGGKRIRPILLLAANEALGGETEDAVPFAIALEMIHTYSLIHDDLPAMDNDDFRRGSPSNHKKFGEGMAILAGDGLLSLAMELCLANIRDDNSLSAAKILFAAAGVNGMVAGQAADLLSEKREEYSEKQLLYIIENKTSKMISAPLAMASALNGGEFMSELKSFGRSLGFLFQVVDDILDVEGEFSQMGKTLGKDVEENKLTSVKYYGLNGAKEYAARLYDESVKALAGMANSSYLLKLADKIYKRNN